MPRVKSKPAIVVLAGKLAVREPFQAAHRHDVGAGAAQEGYGLPGRRPIVVDQQPCWCDALKMRDQLGASRRGSAADFATIASTGP